MRIKITLEKSGGFAGINRISHFDGDILPEDEKKELENLIEESRFFEFAADPVTPLRGADFLHYKLIICVGDKEHSVKLHPEMIPKTLKKLVRFIEDRAN